MIPLIVYPDFVVTMDNVSIPLSVLTIRNVFRASDVWMGGVSIDRDVGHLIIVRRASFAMSRENVSEVNV